MKYEASIICVVFDEKYEFDDILHIGIAHSPTEAQSLIMGDIWRVIEDFGEGKGEIEESRSAYDEPITIAHTYDKTNNYVMHWHYYCLINK